MSELSVVIPTYNYAAYIRHAVESVLGQLQSGDELIVVDDGSGDDTRQVLDPLIAEGRIVYLYQDNTGVSAARNRGAGAARNPYIYFLDADDCVVEGGLQLLRNVVEAHPDAAMVFGGHVSLFEDGRRRVHYQKKISHDPQRNFYDYVIRRRFSIANGGCALVKREVVLKYPFPGSLRVSEDFCVFAWILANHPCYAFEQPVVEIRKHSASLRNQLPLYEQAVTLLPDVLFDPRFLGADLMLAKTPFRCRRMLSLFRAQYLAGEYASAKQTYHRAIACRPANLLELSYLRKYLKLVLNFKQ